MANSAVFTTIAEGSRRADIVQYAPRGVNVPAVRWRSAWFDTSAGVALELAQGDAVTGWVAEWTKAAVLKTAVRETVPGVRIPPHPLCVSAASRSVLSPIAQGAASSSTCVDSCDSVPDSACACCAAFCAALILADRLGEVIGQDIFAKLDVVEAVGSLGVGPHCRIAIAFVDRPVSQYRRLAQASLGTYLPAF